MADSSSERKLVQCMLSTSDNPFNPFERFDDWYIFDKEKGYNTLEYLGRIADPCDEISTRDAILTINEAVEEAVRLNLTGNRIKVEKEFIEEYPA